MDKALLARMGARRLSTLARESLYLRSGVDVSRPESVHCEVIERCNYACRYCHYWRAERYAPEMSTAQWQRALREVRALCGRQPVKFIGGEPFLRKDFVDLLEFCHANDIPWGVTTNGSAFTSRIVARVVAAGPSNIDVSVDSPVPATHDDLRGVPGSLAAIERGLRRVSARRSATGAGFALRIKPTITRRNFRELPRFASWLARSGADTVDFRPVHEVFFWTGETRAALWPDPGEIDELREVMETLVRQKQAGVPIENSVESLRSFPDQFLGRTIATRVEGPCRVGLRDLHIKSDGSLSTCWEFESLGNINDAPLRALWRGEAARRNRAGTVACGKVGGNCANSCRDAHSLKDDLRRGWLMLRASAASPTPPAGSPASNASTGDP